MFVWIEVVVVVEEVVVEEEVVVGVDSSVDFNLPFHTCSSCFLFFAIPSFASFNKAKRPLSAGIALSPVSERYLIASSYSPKETNAKKFVRN